jgi:glycosyltransferase involved in cell wall biosynthesis
LKILIIAPLPPPVTGQSVAVQALVDSLDSLHEISVVNARKKVFVQGFNSLSRLAEVFLILIKIYKLRNHFSVIYFNVSQSVAGNLKDLLIYLICWPMLGRMVIHLHGGAGMRLLMSDKHRVLRAFNRIFLKRMGAVVVLGDRLKNIYSGLVSADKLYAVTNFSDDEYFVLQDTITKKFERIESVRLLFLSNLLPGKGHIERLTALSQLQPQQRAGIRVDFAGGFESITQEAVFRQQAQAIEGIEIKVHGVVKGEEKRRLLEQAHLFCLPTYYPYEGQPISILEAYASGCAVLTTNHSGIFDTFEPGVNGFEVEVRNPESIAEVLMHVLDNPSTLHQFAQTNHQAAQKKYRSSMHIQSLEKIIVSVANPGRIQK